MIQSIYLHRPIAETLSCFGNLSDVINRILQEGARGKFDIMDKPPAPDRQGASRYDVDITEPTYLDLVSMYTPFSTHISIRRLIYWFVENEIYNELDWHQVKGYVSKRTTVLTNKINKAYDELQRAISYSDNSSITAQLKQICKDIENVKRYLNNDR